MSNPFRHRSRAAQVALAAFLVALAVAPAALAATLIGQTSADPTLTLDRRVGPRLVSEVSTGAGPGYTAPSAGVITSWSALVDKGGDPGSYAIVLHTLRPFMGSYIDTGRDVEAISQGQPEPAAVLTFPARLQVQAGDTFGVWLFGAEGVSGPGIAVITNSSGGDTFGELLGAEPSPNQMFSFSTTTPAARVLISALVEADVDGDGFGDESQDQCPTNAGTQAPCPPSGPADTTKPKLSVARSALHLSKKGAVSFLVTADEAATGVASATVNLGKTAKVVRFKQAKLTLKAGKLTKVTLKLPKKKIASVRRALRKKRLTTKVTLRVKDAAANISTKTLRLKLRL
jgi:hypothetical protein